MWEERYYDLSAVAARQHGLFTAAQAKRVGQDDAVIDHFRQSKLIRELGWQVYQLAGSSYGPRFAYPYAAWLATAPEVFRWERPDELERDVVLSHESACALVGLGSVQAKGTRFTSATERVAVAGLQLSVAPLTTDDVMIHEGIPVTTPHRTILDLVAEWATQEDISRVVGDAVRRDLVNLRALFEDLTIMAHVYGFPSGGKHFVDYFLPGVRPEALSTRNRRAYVELVYPQRVAEIRPEVEQLLARLPGSPASDHEQLVSLVTAMIAGR